jgi:choline dehydrogenase
VMRLQWQGLRATGVSIHRYGQEETLFSEREIVLSAGAYGSPQILMLSGVGSADELASFGIPAVAYLPVGSNLQDHPLLPMSYFTDERSLFGAGSPEDVALYQAGRGPLTSTSPWVAYSCQRAGTKACRTANSKWRPRCTSMKGCRRPSITP